MTPIRLACWPASTSHDYIRSLYLALEQQDVHVSVDGVRIEDRFLREQRDQFDALHIHWAEQLWGAGVASAAMRLRGIVGLMRFLGSARRLGVPIVWTVHNLRPHEGGDFVDSVGLWRVAKMSDLTICHDRATYFRLNRWPFRAGGTIMLARHGNFDLVWPPRPAMDAARQELGIQADERLLLCFGLMRPYKGFDLAIEAMKLLGPPYRLVIAGPVTDDVYLKRLREIANADPRISILPHRIADRELVQWLAASDCVLFPYRAITGSGALIGAITAHRGVVASDLPFFRETLSLSPGAGVLFAPGNAGALATAIRQFFDLPASDRQTAAARLSVLHDWRRIVEPIAAWLKANARRSRSR